MKPSLLALEEIEAIDDESKCEVDWNVFVPSDYCHGLGNVTSEDEEYHQWSQTLTGRVVEDIQDLKRPVRLQDLESSESN